MLSLEEIIHAWTDEAYYESLSEAQRASLPQNPAGLIVLTDEELAVVAGGNELEVRTCIVHTEKLDSSCYMCASSCG